MIRDAIANHTGNLLPEEPPLPPARAFGTVRLQQRAALMEALPLLAPGDGIPAFKPAPMEAYGQPCGPFPSCLNQSARWPFLLFSILHFLVQFQNLELQMHARFDPGTTDLFRT